MKRCIAVFDKLEELVIFVGMAVMVTLNFLNVVCRFLLPQTPFSYTEELTVMIFVWITMFGISCAYKKMAHTGLTLLTDRFRHRGKMIFAAIGMAASMLFMAYVIYHGSGMVVNQISHNQILPGLRISASCQSLAIPVGGCVIFLRVIQTSVREICDLAKEGRNEV